MATECNIQYPSNPWKQPPFPSMGKLNFFVTPSFMKGFLVIFLLTILSLSYSIWRADYDQAVVRASRRAQLPTRRREHRTNISHILFGIGGSAETWGRRRRYSELWWKPNATRGYVWLDARPPDTEPWPESSPPFRISGDTSRFRYTNYFGSRSAIRMARIVKESFQLATEDVRWFVMGDDDTVFFPENLVTVLAKYNHKEMYYIGSSSESVEQDLEHSYTMAYGGGGFAISRPLAAALVKILDGCINRYAKAYGSDQKIGLCANEIGVPVTTEVGFHQMDIQGSPYGFLTAHPLAPLVSLHHLDYVHPLFPNKDRVWSIQKLFQAYNSDPGRTLQHSFCYDKVRNWSVSIAWGYSVQLYPFLVASKDLSTPLRTFLTWGSWSEGPFTFNTRPVSLKPCKRAIVYFFDGVEKFGDGNTTTTYRMMNPGHRPCQKEAYDRGYSVTGFNISTAFLDPRVWSKARRRQCCEIISGSDPVDGVVQVRLRGCNEGESVAPN